MRWPPRSAGRSGCRCWSRCSWPLLTAASYAELATKYPRAGGSAVYAERAFRQPLVAFLVGFSMLLGRRPSADGGAPRD
ncbi:hypothetical protein [Geodermatophilus obscurus]|uniref:hypothetical protein n=1 Tax=Geodermatophilus obscurus TaxID=1861 RepID=UPI001FCBCBA4|nr:hypothetical protein [Geodermatophilus obscurus]